MKTKLFRISTLIVVILAIALCFVACDITSNPPQGSDSGTQSSEGTGSTESGNVNPGTGSSVEAPESKEDTVKITFNVMGATYSEGKLEIRINKGDTIKITQFPSALEKSGVIFKGWAYDAVGGAMFVEGDTFSKDTTLFAVWSAESEDETTGSSDGTSDSSTTDSSGGTVDSGDTTDSSNATEDSDTTDSSKDDTTDSSKDDTTDSSKDDTTDSSNDDTTGSSDGTTDSSDTEPKQQYTVKFDVSRTQNGITVPNQVIAEGGKVVKPDFEPYRKGTTFYGWCVGGDKEQVWNFEEDVVTGNITLVAVFVTSSSGTDDCKHDIVVSEFVAPTCQTNGRRVEKCTICRKVFRYNKDNDPTLAKLEHLELVDDSAKPTCADDGCVIIYCPNGCGLSLTTIIPATGEHEYDMLGWVAVVKPTTYVSGREERPCKHCGGAIQTRDKKYTANASKLYGENVDISFIYSGGQYENEIFVNIASLGKVLVSSYFDGTKGSYATDGNTATFWNADTYADGSDYASDWLELEFAAAYDIGAIRFTIPNYTAWELGDDCYVSYDVEYWDVEKEEWVYIESISDKEATPVGMNCEVLLTLESPVNTSKIRAKVTHASRYAPAAIYELETYAKTAETDRVPMSNVTQASVSISGKYNEWVLGADALKDNTTATGWTTDARAGAIPWALYEYATEQYIACVQISLASTRGRAIRVELYQNDEWSTLGTYVVPSEGETGGAVISNNDGICIFNVEIEQKVSKIKFTVSSEPQYWTSTIYDIIPYTIAEIPYGEAVSMGCSHANPKAGTVVAPTCDTAGYTEMNCVCGAVIRTKGTDATGHDWARYTVDKAATAEALGTKVAACRNEGCTATNTINYELNYDSIQIMDYLHGAPAAWAQTYDDGNYLPTYEWVNEHLAKYGAHATVMMSITFSDAYVDIWQEHFEKDVFDLGSHSYNHTTIYSGQLGSSSMVTEILSAQYWFRHNFKNQQLLTFAAPLGATSTSVANYLAGVFAGNRNGGDTGIFYNTPDQLISREVWGDLNSYISKADQTEGDYVFVNTKKPSGAYIIAKGDAEVVAYNGKIAYALDSSYSKMDINLVFNYGTMKFENVGYNAGTYVFVPEDYRYDYSESGSYKLEGDQFVFTEDGSGEYKLVKATLGSYEKGVEKLVSVGGFTVECLHTVGITNVIYSTYESTISKLEHLTRFGVWAPSYQELMQYLKEAKSAQVNIVERTDEYVKISVTDSLDDYMYDQALTIKVDIPDSWTSVIATQGGVEIPLVSLDEYRHTKNMSNVSCAIEDGYLYIDIVPDAGDVVITAGEKNDSADFIEKVTVSFDPGEGTLASDEYETRVPVAGVINKFPTPTRYGYKFIGWYRDAELTSIAIEGDTRFAGNTTLYASWEELPKCVDGTYVHKWSYWLPSTDIQGGEVRKCKKCPATEVRMADGGEIETPIEKCNHTGNRICELCGECYDTILSDWLVANGEYNSEDKYFSIKTSKEAEDIIEYIQVVFGVEDDFPGLIYNAVTADEKEYSMFVYFDALKDGNIGWAFKYNDTTMRGTINVDTFSGSINVLAFTEFDGDSELEGEYAALAATALKRAFITAHSLMIEEYEAPFGMKEMGIVNLNYEIKCDHEGTRVCTLCGKSFNDLLIGFLMENGAYNEVANSYSIEEEMAHDGVIEYIQIIYNGNTENLSLVYNLIVEDGSSPNYAITIDLSKVDVSDAGWVFESNGKTMKGSVSPNGVADFTGALDYSDFDGEASMINDYTALAADAFKGAVRFADAVLTAAHSYAAPFGMHQIGFSNLIPVE